VGDGLATDNYWGANSDSLSLNGAESHLYCFGIDYQAQMTVTPSSGRRAFLSPAPYQPSTTSDPDAVCQGQLAGNFRALVPRSGLSASARFDLNGPTWVRLDGIPWLASASDLAAGSPLTGLNLYPAGQFEGFVEVWTAGAPSLASLANCGDWKSSTSAQVIVGRGEYAGDSAFNATTEPCNNASLPIHVYCLEQ
jgi:hypothetical protein